MVAETRWGLGVGAHAWGWLKTATVLSHPLIVPPQYSLCRISHSGMWLRLVGDLRGRSIYPGVAKNGGPFSHTRIVLRLKQNLKKRASAGYGVSLFREIHIFDFTMFYTSIILPNPFIRFTMFYSSIIFSEPVHLIYYAPSILLCDPGPSDLLCFTRHSFLTKSVLPMYYVISLYRI